MASNKNIAYIGAKILLQHVQANPIVHEKYYAANGPLYWKRAITYDLNLIPNYQLIVEPTDGFFSTTKEGIGPQQFPF